MKPPIYRKLKDYICEEHGVCTVIWSIFGSLYDSSVHYEFTNKEGETHTYAPSRMMDDSRNFLLEYYVMSISPRYEIINDRIIPYLRVYLKEELENEIKQNEFQKENKLQLYSS